MIALFSVQCGKKKGGGLGLGALALAGGGGSSSSSSSNNATTSGGNGKDPNDPNEPGGNGNEPSLVTKCEIKGKNPTYLKKFYTLSYECELITKDYEKTLSFTYDNSIVEIYDKNFKSIKDFTLPKQKDAKGSFQVKTLTNQNFSLTPKIGSESLAAKSFSKTKVIPIPGFTIQRIATNSPPEANNAKRVIVYKDKLYVLQDHLYVLKNPTAGSTWTKVTRIVADDNIPDSRLGAVFIFKDKLWVAGGVFTEQLWSAEEKADETLNWTKHNNNDKPIHYASGVVYQDKVYILAGNSKTIYSSEDGLKWKEVYTYPDNDRFFQLTTLVAMDGKIWIIGGDHVGAVIPTSKQISSFDGTTFVKDAGQFPVETSYYGAINFANGLLVTGGFKRQGTVSYDKMWFSRYGDDWDEVKTRTDFRSNADIVKWRDALYVVEGGKFYKITTSP